jgi:hypothetical protein
MAALDFIICEKRGLWAAALRRSLGPSAALRETRSLSECARELIERPSALVAVEFTARRATHVAEFLTWIGRQAPRTLPIVLAERRLADWEWWLREFGAAHFVVSPRRLSAVREMVARLNARMLNA